MGIQHASMQVTTIENQLMQLMLMHDASHLLPHRSHCGAMMLIPHNGRTHPLWPLIGDPMSSTYQWSRFHTSVDRHQNSSQPSSPAFSMHIVPSWQSISGRGLVHVGFDKLC